MSRDAHRATGQGMGQRRRFQLPAGLRRRRRRSTCSSLRSNDNNDDSSYEELVDLSADFCEEIEANAAPRSSCKNPSRGRPTHRGMSRHCCRSSSTRAGVLAMPASQTRWEQPVADGLAFRSAAARRSRWTPGSQRVSVAGVAKFSPPASPIPRRKQACWMRPPRPGSTSTPSRVDVPVGLPGDHHLSRIVHARGRRGDGVRARHPGAARLRRQVVEGGGRRRVEERRRRGYSTRCPSTRSPPPSPGR